MTWRARCRAFVEQRVIPHCDEWDEHGYPKELHREARAAGAATPNTHAPDGDNERRTLPLSSPAQLYAAGIGGAIFPPEFGGTPPAGCARTPLCRFGHQFRRVTCPYAERPMPRSYNAQL